MAKCVVVLADNGEVYGWGSNEYGQVNRNTLDMSADICYGLYSCGIYSYGLCSYGL